MWNRVLTLRHAETHPSMWKALGMIRGLGPLILVMHSQMVGAWGPYLILHPLWGMGPMLTPRMPSSPAARLHPVAVSTLTTGA